MIADYGRVLKTENWDLAAVGMLRDSKSNTLLESLESVETPILLLWGDEDGWVSVENAHGLNNKFPNSELVLFEGVGHLPMHEVPEDFNASLINFLHNE